MVLRYAYLSVTALFDPDLALKLYIAKSGRVVVDGGVPKEIVALVRRSNANGTETPVPQVPTETTAPVGAGGVAAASSRDIRLRDRDYTPTPPPGGSGASGSGIDRRRDYTPPPDGLNTAGMVDPDHQGWRSA